MYLGRSEVFDAVKTVQTAGKGLKSVEMHRHKVLLIFLFIFLLYGSLGFFGYGNDCDTYGMIRAGQDVFINLKYRPSRFQGSLIPELIIGSASIIGGHYLSNLISAALGSITLFWFFRFLQKYFTKAEALLTTTIIALNPYYIIASCSSMDYIHSLFFLFVGVYLLKARRVFLAAFLFAFAISSRLSNTSIVGGIYLYFAYVSFKSSYKVFWKVLLSGTFALFLSAALFIPSFVASGYSLNFLTYGIGEWSKFEYLARFVYKNIYLFGLLPFIFMLLTTVFAVCKRTVNFSPRPDVRTIISAGFVLLVLQELLFLKVPLDKSYLLPILFIVFPLWTIIVKARKLLIFLLLLTMFYNIMNVDVLDITYNESGTEAIGADVGLFLRPGVLVADLMERKNSQIRYFKHENLPVKRECTDYRTTDFN